MTVYVAESRTVGGLAEPVYQDDEARNAHTDSPQCFGAHSDRETVVGSAETQHSNMYCGAASLCPKV